MSVTGTHHKRPSAAAVFRWQNRRMPLGNLQRIFSHLNPSQVQSLFFYAQIGLAIAVLVSVYLMTRRKDESSFRVREADKKNSLKSGTQGSSLADAKLKRNEPLRISGIRLDGEPHEILGVSRSATAVEIQRAYRELMKRYHPDIVGRPGSREWSDAQKIAEAINAARNQLLAAHPHNPNRSGR